MKKLLYILLSLGLLVMASCHKEETDYLNYDTSGNQDPPNNGGGKDTSDALLKRVYDLVWIVDKQIVDTATFTTGYNDIYSTISHFPMGYFLELVGKKVDPSDLIYERGVSDWLTTISVIGYSESKLYLRNGTWAPRINFGVKDETYSFLIYMNDETNVENWYTSMVYDKEKDIWSGATPVYKFQMFNHTTNESWDMTFPVPINMSFQTTGRKK